MLGFEMDTEILYTDIAPALGKFWRSKTVSPDGICVVM